MTTQHTSLSFDSKGINGLDEYRSRLATFTPAALINGDAEKYGRLFAAAPELLEALEIALEQLGGALPRVDAIMQAAIKKAKGE